MKEIRISKKNLLSLVEQNLLEMPMDFTTADRPDQGIQDKLAAGDTPLKKVPFPNSGQEPNQNYQELLASERYRQVIENLRRYTNYRGTIRGMNGVMPLITMMGEAYQRITQIERAHREELEQLAIELVTKEMGIPEGAFQYDVKITTPDDIDMSKFNMEQGEEAPNEDSVELEKELFTDLENLSIEKAKRRFINSLIQGASKRGHYMYHLVEPRLREITGSDNLINLYGIMMSTNDLNYWQFSDEMIKASGQGQSIAGKEEVDRNTNPPTIVARGINFPIIVHELIKGIMEVIAIQGRNEDEDIQSQVDESEDTLEKEMWDMRLGPIIWDKIKTRFPEKLIDEEYRELQNYLLMEIFRLPARDFFVLMKTVLENEERGQILLQELLDGIESKLRRLQNPDLFNDDEENPYSDEGDDDETPYDETNDNEPTQESEFKVSLSKTADEMTDDELNAFIDEMLKRKQGS